MKYKYALKEADRFGWLGLDAFAYNSKEDFPSASTAYFEVTKSHGKVKTKISDRVYYVVSGEGEFTINGEVTSVKKTDVVIVPKNTPYDYKATKGKLKLFLVHIPAFDEKGEVQLE